MSSAGYAYAALGVSLLIAGFIAYSFDNTIWEYLPAVLIVLGSALTIGGVISLSIKKPRRERIGEASVSVSLKKCPKCGKSYACMQNCPTCGVKLDQSTSPTADHRKRIAMD